MKHYDASLLHDAEVTRKLQLKRITEIVAACTCAWPLKLMRNSHGHDDECPAVAVWMNHHREG